MAEDIAMTVILEVTTSAVDPRTSLESWSLDYDDGEPIRGTEHEREVWTRAGRRYRAELAAAGEQLAAASKRRWLVSGARRREFRQQYQNRIDRARGDYRPVHVQIQRRLADEYRRAADEFRRRQEESIERWRIRREFEPALRQRYREVAQNAVWGWAEIAGSDSVRVFRHDLPGAQPARRPGRRSGSPLTADQLERDLLGLGAETIEWDDAARRAVVEECSTTPLAASFTDWWSTVTAQRWVSAFTLPGGYPGRELARMARRSTSHQHGFGSSDYGGGSYGCSF